MSRDSEALTTIKLRTITPSQENFLRQQRARICGGPPRIQLFASASPAASPGNLMMSTLKVPCSNFGIQLTLPLSECSSSELINIIFTSHKVEFESFSLVDNGKGRLPASQDEFNLIAEAFPTAQSVGVFTPLGGSFKKALNDYDAREHVTKEIFDAAIAHFEQELSIPILSILNLAGPWIVTIPDGVEFSSLPYLLAHTPCHFKYASETEEHKEAAAFRNSESAGTVWDQTSYQTLQPGIMLSSGGGPNELLTTSGIVVEDVHGYRYLTLASHGFPLGRESVYHPNADGALLGIIHDRLAGTDIALLRLSSSQAFRNETFGARLPDGTNILSQKICGIKDPFSVRSYDEVRMNNPFSGYCTGIHVGVQQSKVPSNDAAVDHHTWVINEWTYIGYGRDEPMHGRCGSPVLDEHGNVLSFFRFLTPSGSRSWGSSINARKWGV